MPQEGQTKYENGQLQIYTPQGQWETTTPETIQSRGVALPSNYPTPQNVPSPPGVTPTNAPGTQNLPPTAGLGPKTIPNLTPGASGTDVASLQKFLTSLGFNIPAIQGGQAQPGYFGPQTQQALSQFQQKYNVPTGQNAGYFGPQTKSVIAQNQELSKQFQDLFEQQKGTTAPQNNAEARTTIAGLQEKQGTQQDPQQDFANSYFAMNPISKQLYDTLHDLTSNQTTKTSFVDTYNQLRTQMKVPELNTELLNINRVMRGTEQDIRDEITKGGGSATESQVQAMASARNRLIQKQAATISDQLQVANDYVDKVVSLTQADRQQVWNQLDRQIGLTEKTATIQNSINNAARANYEKIVGNIGYDGLAQTLQNNPNQMRYVESLLGLPGGSFSNPTFLENTKTFREKQLALGTQRVNIQLQGVPGGNTPDVLASQIQYYKTTGQLPPFGFGATGQIARNAFWRALASESVDISSEAATNKVIRSSISKAIATQQNQFSATKTSIDTLDKQLQLVQNLSGQVDRTGAPIANKYLLYLKGQVAGDANTAKLQNAVITASNEFAKILSGAAASISGVTVSSQEEAKNLINANMTKGQLIGVINQMRQEGQYRLGSQKHTIDQLQSDLQNIGKNIGKTEDSNKTMMIGPDGKTYNVLNDQVESFIKAGGKKQ